MADGRWWQRVFAALPRGYTVVEFNAEAIEINRTHGPPLRLSVHGVGVDVYDWRLRAIAKRHTQPVHAASALVRLIRAHRGTPPGNRKGVEFEPEATKVRDELAMRLAYKMTVFGVGILFGGRTVP